MDNASRTSGKVRVRVGPQGRLVIPAPVREELALGAGEELLVGVEDGRLVLEPREAVVRRLRGRFAGVGAQRSLSQELIDDRREEAQREEAQLEERGSWGLG